ncbi:MAG: beta-propeller domain-containing protein, partial [Acidimicrobiales bacterium]
MKTDGELVVTVTWGNEQPELVVIDPNDGQPAVLGRLALPQHSPRGLVLDGDRALVLSDGYSEDFPTPLPERGAHVLPIRAGRSQVIVEQIDLSDPTAPNSVGSLTVDGSLVDTRMVDGVARVVVTAAPSGLEFTYPTDGRPEAEQEATDANRAIIESSTLEQWLPGYELTTGGDEPETGALVPCERMNHPATFAGLETLTVLTLPLAAPLTTGNPVSVLASGATVYGTADGLYVAMTDWRFRIMPMGAEIGDTDGSRSDAAEPEAPEQTTQIHQFGFDGQGRAEYLASGAVPGWLLNQYALSEHEGVLRVATTRDAFRGTREGTSESGIVTLRRDGDQLAPIGEVGGLGQGEQIYAVRFMGSVGYVVTFRQTDPLYTVDLSDPTNLRVVGELKIPGYSAYLHPVGDGLLLGV